MINKELQANIKKTKDFISLWVKFHDLFKDAARKEAITHEEENIFLETKSLITDRYKALKDALKTKPLANDEMMDVISHVLSLKGMAAMSDKALEKIEKRWAHSHVFLNDILKGLEGQSQELAEKRHLTEFLKKVFSKKISQIAALVIAIFFMMLVLNIIIRLLLR